MKLDRVLRGDDEKRRRKRPRLAFDRGLSLAHRLEKARLRARRRPIDLVREQNVRKDRPLLEPKAPVLGIINRAPENVRGQQIGGELDATELA